MYEREKQSLEQTRKSITELLLVRLELGITMCRLAKTAEDGRFSTYLRQASKVLKIADKIMWRLDLNHPNFDQVTAQYERLKFELDSLGSK
jgi:hypothetical protein